VPVVQFLEDSDWIGFDLDHTIIRYKIKPLTELVFSCCLNFLINHLKYEPALFEGSSFDPTFLLRGIILDKYNGNFLHLDSNKIVVSASHGTKKTLSQEEIQGIYGTEPLLYLAPTTPQFWCCTSYFEIPFLYVFGLLIDWYDSHSNIVHELNPPKTRQEIYAKVNEAIFSAVSFTFGNWTEGGYFSEFIKNTHKYIEKRSRVKLWLRSLRKNGKKVMLITNSSFQYTTILLSYAFGPDWEGEFDLRFFRANKPFFFTHRNPFFDRDGLTVCDLKDGGCSVGNAFQLEEFLLAQTTKESLKITYFGDDIAGDVWAPTLIGWKTVAIVEELEAIESSDGTPWPELLESERTNAIYTTPKWNFFFAGNQYSYWYSKIKQHAACSLPCLDRLTINFAIAKIRDLSPTEHEKVSIDDLQRSLDQSKAYKESLPSKNDILPIFFDLRRS